MKFSGKTIESYAEKNVDLEHPMQLLILFYNKRAESYKAKNCALSFQPFWDKYKIGWGRGYFTVMRK